LLFIDDGGEHFKFWRSQVGQEKTLGFDRANGGSQGLHGHKAVAAMGKALELDRGKRALRKQKGGRAHKSDEPLFHTFPHALKQRIVQR